MKRIFNKLDLELYEEKLDNGLEIYIVPKNNKNNIHASFTTKFGSDDLDFILNGEDVCTHPGIAHFLEHKLFEQEDGTDPFQLFDNNGAYSNAFTNHNQTTYYFTGPTNFEENLNFLLDFVQAPYFTDENVEKEKGIIIQELKRNKDFPYRVMYQEKMSNSFVNDNIKIPVIGYIDSINSITKEELMKCYKAFYNPSNMFLVITGNVDPIKTIELIKQNQSKKTFDKNELTKIKNVKEPDKVRNKKVIKYMNVVISKMSYSYKINIENINVPKNKLNKYLNIYFDALFGPVSDFAEEIEKAKIAESDVSPYITNTDSHILVTFEAETNKTNKVINIIKKYIDKPISEEEFNRKKKVLISNGIGISDSVNAINSKITSDVLRYSFIETDLYEEINSLTFEEMNEIISKLNYKYTQTTIIKPNK